MALAVLFCAWPSNAMAGCSHDARVKITLMRPALGFESLGEAGAGVDPSKEAPAPPKPCIGALCSGNPAVPIPPPVPVAPSMEAAVPPPAESIDPCAKGEFFADGQGIDLVVTEGASILRPPR